MDPAPNEEGFSPMRAARAGRRAGKTVAIVEPPSSGSSQQQIPFNDPSIPQQPQQQRQLSPQSSDRQRQQTVQQPQQQQPQTQQQGPPQKRVGFDLQVGSPGADEGEGGASEQRFAGVSRRKQEQLQREEMQQAKQRSKYDEKAIEGVMDIPELEEEGKEDITHIVAQAPKAHAHRVQAMAELDQDQGYLPTRKDEDIDLSLLTAHLLPSDQVVEPPDIWDYDLLFSQLKAELQSEGAAVDATSKDDKEELRQI